MCRFLVYFGNEKILLADLITKPKHSIVQQSFCDPYLPFITDDAKATLKHYKVNGDGFGAAWYGDKDQIPCLFTSIKPSWNDLNLQRLAEHVSSNCIFSHVRAASPKSLIVETNCHPFQAGRLLFMHNGSIAHFSKIKKTLISELSESSFSLIRGTTDTEHAFALFVSHLPNQDPQANHTPLILKHALLKTIQSILRLTLQSGESPEASSLNFAVTNGEVVLATRFKNSSNQEPPSLYYTKSVRYNCKDGESCESENQNLKERTTSVVICSEPLNYNEDEWGLVPKNHLILVTAGYKIKMEPIEVSSNYMVLSQDSIQDDFFSGGKKAVSVSDERVTQIAKSDVYKAPTHIPIIKCGSISLDSIDDFCSIKKKSLSSSMECVVNNSSSNSSSNSSLKVKDIKELTLISPRDPIPKHMEKTDVMLSTKPTKLEGEKLHFNIQIQIQKTSLMYLLFGIMILQSVLIAYLVK